MNVSAFRRLSFGVSLLLAFFALVPAASAVSGNIVISEFRVRGPIGGSDEFIEMYNLSSSAVNIGGWKIKGSNNTGGGTLVPRATIPAGTTLGPGCHYLLTNSSISGGPYSGTVVGNQTYGTGITDDGGIAITMPDDTIVDQVGMSAGSAFKEGTPLASLGGTSSSNLNRGYERKPGGSSGSSTDTDNNAGDFQLVTPNDPQNMSSACIGVTITNPSGVGSANPVVVDPGDSTLLTIAVTPGTSPTSTGITVTVNLTSIDGSANQTFFNDGTNGDVAEGDNVFSYQATVTPTTAPGNKTLPATINDAQGRSGSASIALSVRALVEIFQIQGTGLASPFLGQAIRTNDNVVTAVGTTGFFIQTPDDRADANVETSNGILVFTSSAPTVVVGDQVDVTATVAEFFSLTELTGATVTVEPAVYPLPPVVVLDSDTPSPNQPQPANEMERFEGMLVRVENGVATGPSNQFDEVSIVAKPDRTFREPGILFPGMAGLPEWDGNPEVFEIEPSGLGLPNLQIAGGAAITVAEGPLSFAFGDYQIWPTTLTVVGEPEVIPVRDRSAGEFTVGTQNVLRLFDTTNDPGGDEVVTPAEYALRLNKLSLLVRGALKSPHVLVVQEVEKLAVLQDLAAKIDADQIAAGQPELDYTAYLLEGNDIGGIDIGFLVRPAIQVDSVVQFGADDMWTFDGVTQLLNDRPPLVLRGSHNAFPGAIPFPVTVVGVHQRSLSGIESPSDGPRVREKRHQQALRLSQYIQSLQDPDAVPAGDPNIRLIVAGDFNAFEFTDGYVDVMGQVTGNPDPAGALIPATAEVDPNLTNQTFNLAPEQRYSFVFEGNAQSLDHVLTSVGLDSWTRGAEHARGNADAPFSFESDPATALRSSDHDGTVLFVVGGDSDGDGFADDTDICIASNLAATVVIDSCESGAQNDLLSDGCTISDRISACAAAAVTHEDFTGCVAHLTTRLKKDGFLSNKEKSAIQQCAGKADIP